MYHLFLLIDSHHILEVNINTLFFFVIYFWSSGRQHRFWWSNSVSLVSGVIWHKKKKGKMHATDWVVTSTCVRKEKDVDRANTYGYPGYPAEPCRPPAPPLRMTGRQQSQLETYAVHHTYTNAVSSVCSTWQFWLPRANSSQSRQFLLHCLPVHLLSSFILLLLSLHVCLRQFDLVLSTPCLQKSEWLTWTAFCLQLSPLLSPFLPLSLSLFLWQLFLFLCTQEASTDQVLDPSAFPRAHSSRMGR